MITFGPVNEIMIKFFSILLTASLLVSGLNAQVIDQTEYETDLFNQLFQNPAQRSQVKIMQEKKLDEIMMRYIEQNRKLEGIPLYWIRIYSGSSSLK